MNRLIRLVLFLFVSVNVYGQSAGFIHYSVEDGLPQSQVQTIAQDGKGNLWLGTMSGASRYDGRTFKSFTQKSG